MERAGNSQAAVGTKPPLLAEAFTNPYPSQEEAAGAALSRFNMNRTSTVGTVWSPSQGRAMVAALTPLLKHNQRAETLFPSHPVTLTSLKRISWVLRAQRCYRTVQSAVPARDGLGLGPLSTDTAARPGPAPSPCPFRDN